MSRSGALWDFLNLLPGLNVVSESDTLSVFEDLPRDAQCVAGLTLRLKARLLTGLSDSDTLLLFRASDLAI